MPREAIAGLKSHLRIRALRLPLVRLISIDFVVAILPLRLLSSFFTFFTFLTAVRHRILRGQYRRNWWLIFTAQSIQLGDTLHYLHAGGGVICSVLRFRMGQFLDFRRQT